MSKFPRPEFVICDKLQGGEVLLVAPIMEPGLEFTSLEDWADYVVKNKYAVLIKNVGGKNDNIK